MFTRALAAAAVCAGASFVLPGCSGSPGATAVALPTLASQSRVAGRDARRTSDIVVAPPSVLLADTFDADANDAPAPGWTTAGGSWSVCHPAGESQEYCQRSNDVTSATRGSAAWADYSYSAYVVDPDVTAGSAALLGRYADANHFYQFELRGDWRNGGKPCWMLWRVANGWTLLASGPLATSPNTYYHAKMDFAGTHIALSIDYGYGSNFTQIGAVDDAAIGAGAIGVRAFGTSDKRFDGVLVTGTAAAPTAPTIAQTPPPAPTVAPTPALPIETAHDAGSFVHGLGINMHNSYYGTGYTNDVATIESRVAELGVHVVRDGIALGQYNVCDEDRALAASGIRFDFITEMKTTANDIAAWSSCVGAANIASFEPPNEYDIAHPSSDRNWAQTLRDAQAALYTNVHANLSGVAVLGPALTQAGNAQQVGDLSASMDAGNDHVYFGGREPETPAYGANGYGTMDYGLATDAATFGSKAPVVTETGYGTAGGGGQVDEASQAKYDARLLLEFAKRYVPETILYELVDLGFGPPFANNGLLRPDLSRKPAFNAIEALTTLLGSSPATAGSLAVAVGGTNAATEHVTFRRADGSYVVAVWLEQRDVDPDSGATMATVSGTARVRLTHAYRTTVSAYDLSGDLVAGVPVTTSDLTVPIGDAPTFVTLQ